MTFNRRAVLATGVGALAAAGFAGLPAEARRLGEELSLEDRIKEFTNGAEVVDGPGVTLTAPEIAENGNTVPVEASAPGATALMILAMGNPNPGVVRFGFGPFSATQSAGIRIRLAKTQDVVAIAQMADGSFVRTSATVKVTIGGCGG